MINREQVLQVVETLKGVQQNPKHHAEGDVYTHTMNVLKALESDPEYKALSEDDKELIWVACALHDIGKKVATKLIDGEWKSPKHGSIGSRVARKLLWQDFDLAGTEEKYEFREAVCALIFTHCMPTHFMHQEGSTPEFEVMKLAAYGNQFKRFNLKLLSMLVRADLNGRQANDVNSLLAILDLFVDSAKELGCYDSPLAFANDITRFKFLNKKANSFEYPQYDDSWGTVYMTVGFPGTGKTTWLKKSLEQLPVVSLDEIRQSLGVKHGENQGKVLQQAFENARCLLRGHKEFIWDATCLTPDFRKKQLALFHDYGAKSEILWFETSWNEELRRNASRMKDQVVPESLIGNMFDRFQPPGLHEAVNVRHIVL